MGEPKKEGGTVSVRLEPEMYERLIDFCQRSGQSKSEAIKRALKPYIDEYDAMMAKIADDK